MKTTIDTIERNHIEDRLFEQKLSQVTVDLKKYRIKSTRKPVRIKLELSNTVSKFKDDKTEFCKIHILNGYENQSRVQSSDKRNQL